MKSLFIQEVEIESAGSGHFFRAEYKDGTVCYGLVSSIESRPAIDCK